MPGSVLERFGFVSVDPLLLLEGSFLALVLDFLGGSLLELALDFLGGGVASAFAGVTFSGCFRLRSELEDFEWRRGAVASGVSEVEPCVLRNEVIALITGTFESQI